ncbi:RNA-guided endonuclease IscB [Streptomyces sp. NPDC102360]|uniref:RNA-guided endonuclease IscB n=1 Tax=Streptomyces sp. NPDC102360 TaxID=3366160 RepID=UPI003803BE1B
MATFPVGEQTHPGVLPQRRALESVGADNPGSRDETAHGHPAVPRRDTGREHGRGETDGHGTQARRRHADQAETGSGDAPTPQNYEGGYGAGRVFVLAKDGQPLMPCHPARARELLRKGRAVVARQVPFVIRLKDRTVSESVVDGVQLRIDPGSKGTGFALTDEKPEARGPSEPIVVRRGLMAAELKHRGDRIRHSMQQRAGYRRRRRSANLRYRAPRAENRTRPANWLPPSLRHRVDTTASVTARFCRYAPVIEVHVETTVFDTHAMNLGSQLYACEYQQGVRTGTDIRSHLRARWSRTCAYCGAANIPLNIEHVQPRSRGGSDRSANLVLACVGCNQAKGSGPVARFLAGKPDRLTEIVAQLKPSLRHAAAMNSVQPSLLRVLDGLALTVRSWPSRSTSDNRRAVGLDKTHTLDALAVEPLDQVRGETIVRVPDRVLVLEATGRGSYARTTPDRFGFPRLRRERKKQHFGYVTGDLVRAVIPKGKWAGTWTGRISVRARGQHSLTTPGGRINVSYLHLRMLQRADGYAYSSRQEAGVSIARKIG